MHFTQFTGRNYILQLCKVKILQILLLFWTIYNGKLRDSYFTTVRDNVLDGVWVPFCGSEGVEKVIMLGGSKHMATNAAFMQTTENSKLTVWTFF